MSSSASLIDSGTITVARVPNLMNLRRRDVYEEALERLCEHLEVLLCATRAGVLGGYDNYKRRGVLLGTTCRGTMSTAGRDQ